ncbi:MAG: TonB family protein [Deltaproteobacteria bacterium]|nr:TonB family protein [Deltaproteobacteria bacterium]
MLGWLGLPTEPFKSQEPVSLVNLPGSQWDQNRIVGPKQQQTPKAAQAEEEKPKPPDEEKKKEDLPKGQVVDVAPGNDEKPNDDAKYLAEHNNKVDKQSRAKDQTPFYKNAQPKRTTTLPPNQTTGHDVASKPSLNGNHGLGQDEAEKQQGKIAGHLDVPSVEKRDQVAMRNELNGEIHNQNESEAIKGNSDKLNITPGPQGEGESKAPSEGRAGDKNVANLMPSAAALDKITGAAPNDHLADVDEGDGTFLNTREFKYATFFNRVKQSVGEHWDPSTPLRSRDPEGKIYAYKDRYTLLTVTLDPSGRLRAVSVEKSSGVEFLDDEAVAAFERAQPFPNPPPGLVDHGEVHFTFGFFLEVNSGSSFKIFRSRD